MIASEPRIVTAGRIWRAVLDLVGCDGVTLPWRTIYLRKDRADDVSLRLHEMAHVVQIERDGIVRWTLYSIWYPLRHGYWLAPHEVEARAVASAVSNLMMVRRAAWTDDLVLMAEVRAFMGLTVAR